MAIKTLLICSILIGATVALAGDEVPGDRTGTGSDDDQRSDNVEQAFLGVALAEFNEPYNKYLRRQSAKGTGAVIIKAIVPGTAASRSNLKPGDVVTSINGKALSETDSVQDFTDLVKSHRPGERLLFSGITPTYTLRLNDRVIDEGYKYNKVFELLDSESKWKNARLLKNIELKSFEYAITLGRKSDAQDHMDLPQLSDIVYSATNESRILNELKLSEYESQSTKISSVAEIHFEAASSRLPGVCELETRIHREPTKILEIAEKVALDLSNEDHKALLSLLNDYLHRSELEVFPVPEFPMNSESSIKQLIDLIVFKRSQEEKLFGGISKQEREVIRGALERMFDAYLYRENSENERISQPAALTDQMQNLEEKINLKSLFESELYILSFFSKRRLKLFKKFLASENTRAINRDGVTLIIGSTEDDRYFRSADLIVDFAGADHYLTMKESRKKGIIIDYNGNDTYSSSVPYEFGSGFMEISFLLDLNGDDIYQADSGSLGSGFCGIAILSDVNGNDSYSCKSASMGIGLLGAGILYDHRGDDRYVSGFCSQGVGLMGGIGLLKDDSGDDRYIAQGLNDSSYEEKFIYDGLSQGCGWGVRHQTRGGIGILFDSAGNDQYRSGNFSQGVGYHFAAGFLIDRHGNDKYHTSRYGLGAAAHDASGIFLDQDGDDVYYTDKHAICGAGWDRSVALFIDEAGDDSYTSQNRFSFAAVDHNGLAYHYDLGGNDSYSGNFYTRQSNSYNGGKSFGVFVNLNGQDRYPKKYGNNEVVGKGDFLFIDQ